MKPRFTCANRPSNCQLHQLANCCVCSRRRPAPPSSRGIPCNPPACSRPCHHQIPDYDAYDYPDQRACCSCYNGYDDINVDMFDVNKNDSYDSFDDEHDSRITNFSERSRPSTNSSRSEISDRSERSGYSDRSYRSQRSDKSRVSNISDKSQNSDTSQGESRKNQSQHQKKEGNQRTKWSNTKTDGYCAEHGCEEIEYSPKRRAKVTCSHVQYYPSDDICTSDLRPLCDGNRLPSALRQPKDTNQNSGKETKITQKSEVEGQQSTDDSYTFNISVKPPKSGSSSDQSQDDDRGFQAQLIITTRPQTTGKPISAQLTLSSNEKDGKVEIHEIEDGANEKPDNVKEFDKKPPKGDDKQSDGESQMSTKQSTSGQSKQSTKPSITSNRTKGSIKSASTGGQSKESTKVPPKDHPQQINNQQKMNAWKVDRAPIMRPEQRMEMNPNNTEVQTMYRSSAQSDSVSESMPPDPFLSTNRDQGTIMWQNESTRPNYTNKTSSYTFLESEPSVPFDGTIPNYTSSFTSGIKATSSKIQADIPAQNQRYLDNPHPSQDHRLRDESSLRVLDVSPIPAPPGPQISYHLSNARSSQDRPVRITENTSQQSQSNSNPRKSETSDRSSRSNAQPLSNPMSKTQSENRQHNAVLEKLPSQASPTTDTTTTNRPQDTVSQELQRWTSNPPIENKPLDVILQPKPLGDLKLRSSKEPPKGSRRAKRGQVEIADQPGKNRVKDIPNPERNKDPLSEESIGFIPKLNATVKHQKVKEAPSTSQNKEQKLGKSIPQSLDPKNHQQDQSPTYFNDAPPTVLIDTTKPNPPNSKVGNIIENTIRELPAPQSLPNEAKLDQLISLYEKRSRLLDNDDDEDEVKFPSTNLVPIIKSTRISPLTKLQINRQRIHKHKEADNKANRIKRQKEADEVKTIIKPGKNVIMLRPSSDTIHINYVLQTPTIQFSAVPGSSIAKTYISKNSDQPESSRYYCVCSQRSPPPYQAPVLSRMQQTVYGLPKNRTRKASEYPQNKCTVLPHLLPAKSNKHQQL